MDGELTIKNGTGDLIQGLDNKDLDTLLKPLIQEIHLFDSFVAGTTHLKDPSVLDDLKEGSELKLIREDNKFDDNAIKITDEQDRKIGYVPEKDNIVFARLMDAGKVLGAKVNNIEKKGSFTKISIGIYLVDF